MTKRIITGLLIIAVVVPPLILGGYFLDALIGCIVLVGGFELFAVLPTRKFIPTVLLFGLLAATFFIHYLPLNIALACFSVLALVVLSTPVFYEKISSEDAFYIIGVLALFFALEEGFLTIYNYDSKYVWFILIATYGCDTGAYFVGSQFGSRKLAPRISPNKSVEGAIGGWFVGAALSLIYTAIVFPSMPLLAIILGCIWLPITSQIGDLSFSAIKRHFNIKDFSNIFPGHGGFMDRLDSLLFNVIVFYMILELALW